MRQIYLQVYLLRVNFRSMKTIVFLILLFSQFVNAHDILLECTVKMQRLGFERVVADEACAMSAGRNCSEMQSQVIQKVYPDCVGELIYIGVRPIYYAMNFCNMTARRQKVCVPQNYITDREKFAACVNTEYTSDEIGNVLNRCLEKILLNK